MHRDCGGTVAPHGSPSIRGDALTRTAPSPEKGDPLLTVFFALLYKRVYRFAPEEGPPLMKISLSRTRTSLLLIALAFLSASAGAQGGCCQCSFNGTNCSACCYVDQDPRCPIQNTGSVFHCACYCELIGGGEGGGGVGCTRIDSSIEVMGTDRNRDPSSKVSLPGGGLLNPGRRREGAFNFEEWALVAPDGGILGASTPAFAGHIQALPERYLSRRKGASAILVIEDADHPLNGREIPVPSLAPIDIDAGLPASAAGQEAWFRAEVGEDEVVDQVVLLNLPEAFQSSWFNDRLREHLHLRYGDARRHRMVVFGLVRVDTRGHLVLVRSKVLLPKCCCTGSRCV